MAKTTKPHEMPTHDEIAACARRIYEMEGRPEGKAMEHWLRAEAQLIAERKALAAVTPAKPAPAASATAAPRGNGWRTQPAARTAVHRN
jgi:hypothetical protein